MGRVPFSAPSGDGFGAAATTVTATVPSGSSQGFNVVSGTGQYLRLVAVNLHAPSIASSTGSHEFRIVSGTGYQTVVAKSSSTSEIDVDGVAFVTADQLKKPATDAALAEALMRTVGTDTQTISVGYYNDSDLDQTGDVTIEVTTVRGSQL